MEATKMPKTTSRIQSIDILRGLVMVLMAIDHVRVYSGVPAGAPDLGIFFTRWLTHFCAPGFVFFAGTSAFLYGHKVKDKGALARFLLTRGLLLIVLEITLIRFLWTFNLNLQDFLLAGVIWMLGWCMVIMAGLIYLRPHKVAIIGLLIIFSQGLFFLPFQILPDAMYQIWQFVYPSGTEDNQWLVILYVIVPWIGVMAAGYGFGKILLMDSEKRRKLCLWIGGVAIGLFLIIGSILVLRKENWSEGPPFIVQLLRQRKYPASALFLLMTLGPLIALIPYAEKLKGALANVLKIFGRVPMFYYLLHILFIHLSSLLVNLIRTGGAHQDWYTYAPFTSVPAEHRWGLPVLYLVFLINLGILYFICRWYAKYKSAHPEKRCLKYL